MTTAYMIFIMFTEVLGMKATNFLLIIFQAAVIVKSLAYSNDGDNDCQFTYDDSSLVDDSDYHPDGSGDGYEIGGNTLYM